jgi:predicted TIM-barrel fold metal-dependent hydrolase
MDAHDLRPAGVHSPVIDGHAHSAGDFCRGENVVRILDGLGVDKVVLCPGPINEPKKWPVPALARVFRKRGLGLPGNRLLRLTARYVARRFDFDGSNAYVASLARRFPGRIAQACWVDPGNADVMRGLTARHDEWKFKAVKLHQCYQRFKSDSPGMHELARFAGDKRLPIFIHLYAKRDAVDLLKLIAAHPETTFVIAHLLGLEVFAAGDRSLLQNVFYDISPPNLCPLKLVQRALGVFGAEKLLLGSDTPYGKNNLKLSIDRVRSLDLTETDKALILGGNALRVYFGVGPN